MKKIIVFTILLFPFILKASTINKMYIDSEIDISGNLIVKEIIDTDGGEEPINIYYKNEIDDIYKGTTVLLRNVGVLDSIDSLNEFYYRDFFSKHVKTINDYEEKDDGKYLYLYFKEKNVYYVEYIILNLCVKHNDASELYYRYLYNFNHDIDECSITLRLPQKSELFDVYVHSDSRVKVTKDLEKSAINLNIKKYKKDSYLDVRLLFDRDIFSININSNKEIDDNILDIIKKEEFNSKYILYILIVLFILCLISIIFSHFNIDIINYNISNSKIDKDIKLLVLSDIHDRNIYKRLEKIINLEKPDYVIISGDAINGRYLNKRIANKRMNAFIKFCSKIKDFNVYYTYGNHETYISNEQSKYFKKELQELKINILNNKTKYISDNIKLCGLFHEKEYYNRKKYKITKEYLKDKIGNIDHKNYNIIVCHNPLVSEQIEKYKFDMMISGHIHGGVIRIPMGLLSPEYKFFPKYSNGLYEINNMKLLVSRGLGYCKTLPIRVNNPGHIMIINLSKED